MNQQDLIGQGKARLYRGRLIPLMSGADPVVDPLFPEVPEDLSALDDDALNAFIDASVEAINSVTAAPGGFVVPDVRSAAELLTQTEAAVAWVEAARAELENSDPGDETPEGEEPEGDDPDGEELATQMAELATRAAEPEVVEPVAVVEVPAAVEPAAEPVTAAAPATVRRIRPARSARSTPTETATPAVALTASANVAGVEIGDEVNARKIVEMMIARHRNFARTPVGAGGEKFTIASANWAELYPDDRKLGTDMGRNMTLINEVVDQAKMKAELAHRRENSLQASGGLCAPTTPYYGLAMVSTADRPVRAALAAFNADRGGIRFARPASLAAITTAIDIITESDDSLGGTFAVKSCQRIDCPPFEEVVIQSISHCLEFGNIGSRTFPELMEQWNDLVLAQQARVAETALLTGISAASTQVVANDVVGMGASASLLHQIVVAAAGIRNRHRMQRDAVLRVLLPAWILDLLVSDVYRSQFGRFEMTQEKFVGLMRDANVEPTFYLDGATGAQQVFGTQAGATGLADFPAIAEWYIFPEGSFLFIDGGSLELGLVRDSTLNETNDFQIFGETWENVAFTGIESLEIRSALCASGAVSLPIAEGCPNFS